MSVSVTVPSNETLNKDVQNRVKELQKLVLEDDVLKKLRTEEIYLLRFLHCENFNVAEALQRIKAYCNLLIDQPLWFGKASPLEKKEKIEFKDKVFLDGRDKAGRPVLILKTGKIRVSDINFAEQAVILDYWFELVLDDSQTQATGVSAIVDMDGYSWKYLSWFTPSNVRVAAKKMNLYPIRDIVIHVVNTSLLLNASIKIIWPFLNERLKNMFKFHFANWSSLHEHINPDILPPEYGGNGPELDFEDGIRILFDQDDIIAAKLKYRQAFSK
ncbi:hypothetical protein ILUMI_15095 [Ignelater luminosus]|uniref:CRAL-TRIO domain-containing protein n=1 Tax=Ignelater luminosus TaxID=2038154 RepID=A0A8K0CUR6_IGNLU|nr:hypothetical protein ILUMI_15095 [Ignelater luminosus]